MACQHLARHLRVTRLIRAKQSNSGETEEEEKSAESGEQEKLAEAVLAETHGNKCNAGGDELEQWR
jgi:hypothetical protein